MAWHGSCSPGSLGAGFEIRVPQEEPVMSSISSPRGVTIRDVVILPSSFDI